MASSSDACTFAANMHSYLNSKNLPFQEITIMTNNISNNMKILLTEDYIQNNKIRTIIQRSTKSCFRVYKKALSYSQYKTDQLLIKLPKPPGNEEDSTKKRLLILYWYLVRKLTKHCNSLFAALKECGLQMDLKPILIELRSFYYHLVSALQRFNHLHFEVTKNLLNRV